MKKLSLAGLALLAAVALSPMAVPAPANAADVTVGTWGIPPGKGNPYTGIGTPSIFTWDAIFDPLVRISAAGEATPILAKSWKNVDPTHWEFTLRQNVKFSNGEAFNADAVVNAFDYLGSEAGKATAVGRELSGVTATKKDDYTVVIETKGPDPVLPNKMALVYMVAPGAWTSLGPEGFADKPVGTGSFKLDSWTANSAVLSANADSWRAPRACRRCSPARSTSASGSPPITSVSSSRPA
jgi:peptide/nickel transport system substrate-binding protein